MILVRTIIISNKQLISKIDSIGDNMTGMAAEWGDLIGGRGN